MYVMKFNTPILPFAKFPLTQNKYIQDFLKSSGCALPTK
jgi:hypothetical protein